MANAACCHHRGPEAINQLQGFLGFFSNRKESGVVDKKPPGTTPLLNVSQLPRSDLESRSRSLSFDADPPRFQPNFTSINTQSWEEKNQPSTPWWWRFSSCGLSVALSSEPWKLLGSLVAPPPHVFKAPDHVHCLLLVLRALLLILRSSSS